MTGKRGVHFLDLKLQSNVHYLYVGDKCSFNLHNLFCQLASL